MSKEIIASDPPRPTRQHLTEATSEARIRVRTREACAYSTRYNAALSLAAEARRSVVLRCGAAG
ncbi:MAG: hypothetical protein NVS3B20_20070 [Polyangiales bacterium]